MVDRMIDRVIGFAGKLLIHVVRALLVCWQRMLRLGVSVGVLGGVVALVFGSIVTHAIPPAPLTWVTAMFFGVAVGYAAAMTVLADELLLGVVDTIGVLEGDVKAGIRAAAVAAEREAGEAGRGIMRVLGHPRATTDMPPAPSQQRRPPPSQPLLTLSTVQQHTPTQSQADETLAAIAATERFLKTAPRPRVDARPVRADQLPRIEWASEEAERRYARTDAASVAMSLTEMPALPIRTLRSQVRAESAMAAPAAAVPVDQPVTVVATQPVPTSDAPVATRPSVPLENAAATSTEQSGDTAATPAAITDDERTQATVLASELAQQPAAARPLTAISPNDETGQPDRGIWTRIGQALIGNTTRPLQDGELVSTQDEHGSEGDQP